MQVWQLAWSDHQAAVRAQGKPQTRGWKQEREKKSQLRQQQSSHKHNTELKSQIKAKETSDVPGNKARLKPTQKMYLFKDQAMLTRDHILWFHIDLISDISIALLWTPRLVTQDFQAFIELWVIHTSL